MFTMPPKESRNDSSIPFSNAHRLAEADKKAPGAATTTKLILIQRVHTGFQANYSRKGETEKRASWLVINSEIRIYREPPSHSGANCRSTEGGRAFPIELQLNARFPAGGGNAAQ